MFKNLFRRESCSTLNRSGISITICESVGAMRITTPQVSLLFELEEDGSVPIRKAVFEARRAAIDTGDEEVTLELSKLLQSFQ